jgi:para-nitrobenzyl esterase
MQQKTVMTNRGPLIGRMKEEVWLFAGVPYAAPPLDDLRFKAPQPHPGWDTPREALKFAPAAPQVSTGGMTDSAPVRWSEDCLTLNISTPACDDDARPVLVWIHGGGYRTGQSSIPWYNGARFAQAGIVVVSINYRLGALGFTDLSHLGDDYADSAINGILDQVAALRWVQENISGFGGDPAKVTIAGESAGGFSVSTLLGMPAAQGLFHHAIPQSGGAHHTLPRAAAQKITKKFLSELGEQSAMHLSAVSVDDILKAQVSTSQHFESGAGLIDGLGVAVSPFYPAHGTPQLPESPLDAIRAGCGSNVAVLTGTNTHETTLWGYGKVDEAKLVRIAQSLGAQAPLAAYRKTRPKASPEELVIALTTDHMFRIPAIRLAEARAAHNGLTWMYLFNWSSRAFGGRLKATHALEIPFAFNNLDRAGVDAFIGPGAKPQSVADVMHEAWIEFIKHGVAPWDRYELGDRTTMVFDDPSAIQHDPYADERTAWAGLR